MYTKIHANIIWFKKKRKKLLEWLQEVKLYHLISDRHTHQCDDIAIIGAGVTGSYAAWRLRHSNLKISIYEYSNRIGGRCFTVQFPDIPDVNLEMGAMRFLPACKFKQ